MEIRQKVGWRWDKIKTEWRLERKLDKDWLKTRQKVGWRVNED